MKNDKLIILLLILLTLLTSVLMSKQAQASETKTPENLYEAYFERAGEFDKKGKKIEAIKTYAIACSIIERFECLESPLIIHIKRAKSFHASRTSYWYKTLYKTELKAINESLAKMETLATTNEELSKLNFYRHEVVNIEGTGKLGTAKVETQMEKNEELADVIMRRVWDKVQGMTEKDGKRLINRLIQAIDKWNAPKNREQLKFILLYRLSSVSQDNWSNY